MIAILIQSRFVYFISIKIQFISSRKPFALKGALIIYNLAVSILNLYIAIELLIASTSLRYNYVCEPCRHQDFSKDELRVCDCRSVIPIPEHISFALR